MEVELPAPASDSGGVAVDDVHGRSFVRVDAATGHITTVEVARM